MDFPLAWLGLLAIGAAPALINSNLKGDALLHVVDVSTGAILLVDGDDDLLLRVADVTPQLISRGVNVINLDDVRRTIHTSPAVRPPDELRENINPNSPLMLFYTRYRHSSSLDPFVK
jgi:acyl-CoA synthetase (AMP-forming)/AMP-acid ligase II